MNNMPSSSLKPFADHIAEIWAVCMLVTVEVVIGNEPDCAPKGITSELGTVTPGDDQLVTISEIPLGPAAPMRLTVPVELAPPITLVGEVVSTVHIASMTVSEALLDVEL